MCNKKTLFGLFLCLTLGYIASAQDRVKSDNLKDRQIRAIEVNSNTVDEIQNLSIIGDKLYFYSSGVMFSATLTSAGLTIPVADVTMTAIDPDIDYIVRHPSSRQYYFTKKDNKGVERLYMHDSAEGKNIRVKLGRFHHTIVHPVFSDDGQVMVFSSNSPIGFGGYDLWYSQYADGKWQDPQNMGSRINSDGNEIAPCISWGFLYFSSNSHREMLANTNRAPAYHLFATHLIANKKIFGDTIVTFPIGRGTVQPMSQPFNSENPTTGFAVDSTGTRGVWSMYSNKEEKSSLNTFWGRTDGVLLYGQVSTPATDNYITKVAVAQSNGDVLYEILCSPEGHYSLILQPQERYQIIFSHQNCFSTTLDFYANRINDELLYAPQQQNIILSGFFMDYWYAYSTDMESDAFFVSEASSDITPAGKSLLEQVAMFLNDNPSMQLDVILLRSPLNDNETTYCSLLNEVRVESVKKYLATLRFPDARIRTVKFSCLQQLPDEIQSNYSSLTDGILLRFREK